MRRKHSALSEAIGTDAFLDIVANLVGILLIFITVIGVRMEDASKPLPEQQSPEQIAPPVATLAAMPMLMSEPRQLPSMPEPLNLEPIDVPDTSAARLEFSRIKSGIRNADEEAKELARLMRIQKMDRDNLMLAISRADIELDRRRAALDSTQKEALAAELESKKAKEQFESLMAQIDSLKAANANPKREVLQHLSTPIAKTVFVREEHFRLKDGRLLYVPLNEMTKQLRQDAPKKMWKLKTAQQTTETIGPRDGFEMRYTLRRNRVPFQTESGRSAVREVVELDRFVMVPVGRSQGDTVKDAMNPTSVFRSRVSGWNPRDTIVTVWTYPNSFGEFRELKAELYKLGYLTAARPLPADQLISGSPQGTRSAAQ